MENNYNSANEYVPDARLVEYMRFALTGNLDHDNFLQNFGANNSGEHFEESETVSVDMDEGRSFNAFDSEYMDTAGSEEYDEEHYQEANDEEPVPMSTNDYQGSEEDHTHVDVDFSSESDGSRYEPEYDSDVETDSDVSSVHSDEFEADVGENAQFVNGDRIHLSFEEYVDACFASTTLEDKINLHFNRRIRIENVLHDFVVDTENQLSGEIDNDTTLDIDGFVTHRTQYLPYNSSSRLSVFTCPNFSHKIQRNEYGQSEIDGQNINNHRIPHTLLFVSNGEAAINTYIFFPGLFDNTTRSRFLTSEEQSTFIDKIFLPSLKKANIPQSVINRIPASHKSSIRKGIQTTSTHFLSASEADRVIPAMRRIITQDRSLSAYASFFFVSAAFGFKQNYHRCCIQTFR